MKNVLALSLLFFYLASYSQIVIDGQINNYDGKSKVYYSRTVDGILTAFDNISNEVQPGANGRFRIKYENKGWSSTRMGFSGLTFSFVHDGDSRIKLIIDQARIQFPKDRKKTDIIRDSVKQAATIAIEGDFADINRFNNRTARSSTVAFRVNGCHYSKLISEARVPSRVVALMDSLIQIELSQLDLIGSTLAPETSGTKKATPELKKFMEIQIHSFYGTVFLTAMMLKRIDQAALLLKDTEASHSIYNEEWEELTEDYLINSSKTIRPLPASFEYNEFILSSAYTIENYKKYDLNGPAMTDDELVIERLLRPRPVVLDSLGLINDQAVLAYKVHNLSRFLYTQTFYSPVLFNAVKRLKAQYPDSELLKPFEPKIELLQIYLEKSSSAYDKCKIIPTNFVYFSDLLEQFKGKNLLIDIWATWCAPCVEDFNYKSLIKPFVAQGKLTILYISLDKPGWRKKWEENMRFNELEGYHVLANDVLIQDMWKQLGGRAGLIPRYALIDENGSIYLGDAARPSEGKKLLEQVEGLIGTE